ncbi:MAG TPA: cytochrome P450 [Candidatus Saccharimonadales bacterium]|nr:cytochrome P450 [Candidatus Saccharimonadales bacterium]
MDRLQLPFNDPEAYQEGRLAAYYDMLHQADVSSFDDPEIGMTVVWRYKDVEQVMLGADPAISNKNSLDPLTPLGQFATNPQAWPHLVHLLTRVTPSTANAPKAPHDQVKRTLLDSEHPRSLRPQGFADRYGDLIRERVDEAASDLRTALEQKRVADFGKIFAGPVAAGVIGAALGLPRAEWPKIERKATAQAALLGQILPRNEQAPALGALVDLSKMSGHSIRQNIEAPTDSLAGLLARQGDRALSKKLATSAMMNLVAAGFITTYGTILNSERHILSTWGSAIRRGLSDPATVRGTITESLRTDTSLLGWKRKTVSELTLPSGAKIPPNRQVVALIGAANRDPNVFSDPHERRPDRYDMPRAPRPLTFGLGPHYCVGYELATLELTTALLTVREQLPDLQLHNPALIKYKADSMFRLPATAVRVMLGA